MGILTHPTPAARSIIFTEKSLIFLFHIKIDIKV